MKSFELKERERTFKLERDWEVVKVCVCLCVCKSACVCVCLKWRENVDELKEQENHHDTRPSR